MIRPISQFGLFAIVAALCSTSANAQATRPASAEIDRLINLLGDNNGATREQATRDLTQMGDVVLPAVHAAMKHPDLEIRQRAEAVYRGITDLPADRQQTITEAAAKAFANTDYEAAAIQQMLLARRLRPAIAQCLSAGQDWQLAGKYSDAVTAYQRTLDRINEVLGGDPESDPPPPPPAGMWNGRGNGIRGIPGLNDYQRREYTRQRAGLMLLIARLQRDELNDPAAAIVTLGGVVDSVPEFKGDAAPLITSLATDIPARRAENKKGNQTPDWDRINRHLQLINEYEIMQELARTQEQSGDTDDAILTLARLINAETHLTGEGMDKPLADLIRLIPDAPAASQIPASATLITLLPPPAQVKQRAAKIRVFADSPFHSTPTNFDTFGLGSVAVRDIQALPDGRWIAAFTAGPRIYFSTSRDLITWGKPDPLSHNSIANNTDPAIIVDDHGVIWLAWFANPLSLETRGSAGYTLWLAHSTDGKSWSQRRAISADTGGWPMGSMSWLHTTAGQYRLSWRAAFAMAASPGDITALKPITMTRPDRMWPMEPSVICDSAGQFHMVLTDLYSDPNHGLSYANSNDGEKWSDPIILLPNQLNRTTPTQPQMIMDDRRVALLYQDIGGGFIRIRTVADPPTLSPPIQISDGTAPTAGTPWRRVGDEVIGFTSGEHPFCLRAKIADLFKDQ